ncbi:Sec-independent protein translocase subunit TatA2 [Campylobacter jejuni]|nr:Sec-independent protein translocase subunit TatA2 [Campylobacter jejuni]
MVFLIPLLIIIGVIFGIDYMYFKNQDLKVQVKKEQKELNSSLEKEKKEYIEKLFKTK